MDKTIIQHNNKVKFEKNKINDKQLRHLDNKLFNINKKIKTLSQISFIQKRELKDINECHKKNPYQLTKYLKKIKILAIKSIWRTPSLKFKYYNKKYIEKKISQLI